jgi:hypothetical protein
MSAKRAALVTALRNVGREVFVRQHPRANARHDKSKAVSSA